MFNCKNKKKKYTPENPSFTISKWGVRGYKSHRHVFSDAGLVTLTEMKAKQEDVVKLREKQLAKKDAESRLKEQIKADKKRKEKMKVGILLSLASLGGSCTILHKELALCKKNP